MNGLDRAVRASTRHLAWSALALAMIACSSTAPKPATETTAAASATAAPAVPRAVMPTIVSGPVSLKESYLARREATSQLRGLTLAPTPVGPPHLVVGDAGTDQLVIFDASTGRFDRRIGERGSALRQYQGITDVHIADRLVFVSETGNQRVQVQYLPDYHPIGAVADGLVTEPAALAAVAQGGGDFMLYVIDRVDHATVLRLIKVHIDTTRIHQNRDPFFSVAPETLTLVATPVTTVPIATPETSEVRLMVDAANDRLLLTYDRMLAQFGLDGTPKGAPAEVASVQGEIRGIGMFACPQSKERGYYILADREAEAQHVQVIDRQTLEPVTRFHGLQARGATDLLYVQQALAYFPFGAVYVLSQDTAVAAFDWQALAVATGVRRICL